MTKFIALVSGKGGVGKTTSTINIGQALVNLGHKVTLLDANLTTPNLAIQLGLLELEGTVNHFLRKEKNLSEITYFHEGGLKLIPTSPSFHELKKTDTKRMVDLFEHLNHTTDFVLVDSPSGLGSEVTQILDQCDEAIIVVNPSLSSIMDGLKTIELAKTNKTVITGILLNMSNRGRNELKIKEIEETLGYPILANVRYNRKIRKSAYRQTPLNYLYPKSKYSREFTKVASFLTINK